MDPITRRGFLIGAAGAAGLFVVGGVAVALDAPEERSLLRPPGAQDEVRLLANCIKCDRCRSVCPTGAIVTALVEDGLAEARTPLLDFHRGYCDFCGKCLEVCPTSAIVAFDEAREKIGIAVIDESECVAFRQGGCRVCVDACPYQAISVDGSGRPVVDEAVCNGCGVCEYVCPSATYGSYSGSGARGVNVEARG